MEPDDTKMASAVTAQWSLDRTATGLANLSAGVMEAATSDNVQPNAILASEAFGGTLMMSSQSMEKVRALCSQEGGSNVLSYLKFKIGFRRGDSGWYLSKSDAGLRFLGLASCLMSINPWQAAEMLRKIILSMAEKHAFVPTSQQIKQLLQALDYRLATSGFLESVIGWGTWLSVSSASKETPVSPGAEIVSILIRGLSDLTAQKGTRQLRLKIHTTTAAWTIAFIQWCSGCPPIIVDVDDTIILHQENNCVRIQLVSEISQQGAPEIFDELHRISNLIVHPQGDLHKSHPLTGLMSLSACAQNLISQLNAMCADESLRPMELFASACWDLIQNDELTTLNCSARNLSRDCTVQYASPFDADRIENALSCFMQDNNLVSLIALPNDESFCQSEAVCVIRQDLFKACGCTLCTTNNRVKRNLTEICLRKKFFNSFAHCVLIILLTSLLRIKDMKQLHFDHLSVTKMRTSKMVSDLAQYLEAGGSRPEIRPSELMNSLLQLLGHDHQTRSGGWVIASHGGQTIYAEVLQTLTISPDTVFNMVCVPGVMMYENHLYNTATASSRVVRGKSNAMAVELKIPGLKPLNQHSDQYKWRVARGEHALSIALSAPFLSEEPEMNPLSAIHQSANCWFINCEHDLDSPLDAQAISHKHGDLRLLQVVPGHWMSREIQQLPPVFNTIEVVMSDRNEMARYFSIGMCRRDGIRRQCIVRNHACLECCIDAASVAYTKGHEPIIVC